MGSIASAAIPIITGMLGNKESKPYQNMQNDALKMQGTLANQYMQPYNSAFAAQSGQSPYSMDYDGNGNPVNRLTNNMTPLDFAIQQTMAQAVNGYSTPEANAQRNVMNENIDRDYQSALNQTNEAMAGRYLSQGADSGTRLSMLQKLIENRNLQQQGNERDLFLRGEDFKRQQVGNLAGLVQPMLSMPLQAAGVYQNQGQGAGQRVGEIQQGYQAMGNALGQMAAGRGQGSPDVPVGDYGQTPNGPYSPNSYSSPYSGSNYGTSFDTNRLEYPTTSTTQAPSLAGMQSYFKGSPAPRSPYTWNTNLSTPTWGKR
jgi:hypothetical protein